MRLRNPLARGSRAAFVTLALVAVACGGRAYADASLPDASACGWSHAWSDQPAPNDCSWHLEFDGDVQPCAGFPEGAGTAEQCRAVCGEDHEGDSADTCAVTGPLGDGAGTTYMLSSAATVDAMCGR